MSQVLHTAAGKGFQLLMTPEESYTFNCYMCPCSHQRDNITMDANLLYLCHNFPEHVIKNGLTVDAIFIKKKK